MKVRRMSARGSEAEILKANQRVRFAPTSGHSLRQVPSALQSGVVERRSFGFALTFFGFALTFLVYRGVVVRGGGVTTEVAPGGRRTKSCRLLPPGADRSWGFDRPLRSWGLDGFTPGP